MKLSNLKPLYWLFLIPLPLFLPYLLLDRFYFWGNPDGIFYANIYTSYRDALLSGEFFPHWIASANIGMGSLAFYSLSPLVYSITALINAPLLWLLTDNQQMLVGFYASQLFGAWAMWYWLRRHYDERLSVAGAAIYTLIPYKFIVLYQHFNLAQMWAMAFLPLWFYAAEDMQSRARQIVYAVMGALCFYAHPLTVISIGPLVLVYGLHRARWQWRPLVKPLLLTHALILALISSYLAAMLTSLPWMQLKHWSGELFSALGNLYHIDDFLGLYAILILWLVYRQRQQEPDTLYFWGIVLAVLYVVATPLSYPLWAFIPAMNVFQFPFARLQPGMVVAVTLLCMSLLARRQKDMTVAVASILLLFVALCCLRLHLVYNRPHTVSQAVYEMAREDHIMPATVYMPHWTPLLPNDLLLRHYEYKDLARAQVTFGRAKLEVKEEGNGWMNLHVNIQSPIATIVPTQFYIPAWKAYDGEKEIAVQPYPNGLIKLELDKGEHTIRLRLEKTTLEILGDMVTLLALAAIPLLLRRSYAFKKS